MKSVVSHTSRLEATLSLPGDKSISHRAVLLNAISTGPSVVTNYCPGEDGAAMVHCLRGLGIKIAEQSGSLEIDGKGLEGLIEPVTVLNASNSGTSLRVLAGLRSTRLFMSVLTGDKSLRSRPMGRVIQPLKAMGAQIMGRQNDTLAPLAIRGGHLHGIAYTLPVASAQLKTCLMVAALGAEGETVLHQPAESRDHTERMLRSMGGNFSVDNLRITIRPSVLQPVDVRVPGDISAAAFWLVAGCCHPNAHLVLQSVGVNPTRTGVLTVLKNMNARITVENPREEGCEPIAELVVETSNLEATEIGGQMIPLVVDELPVLALAACFAKGITVIKDAQELRVKESDRIATTLEGLRRLGATVEERPDGMVIHGGARLKGAECKSYGDHRIAMTMAIAGLLSSGKTIIRGAEAADVSYPGFWETIKSISVG